MNNFSFGGGGKKRRNDFIGGRPKSDANYAPKKRGFDKKSGFRGNDRRDDRGGDRELFAATCTTCGKACEVPFRPDGSKPVLCRDCFAKNHPADRADFKSPRDFDRGGDRVFRKPERTFDTPKAAPQHDTTHYVALAKQVSALEAKLDEVLTLLRTTAVTATEETASEAEVTTPAKASKPKKAAATKKVAKKATKKVVKKAAKKSKK